ncbi:MAG TPA: hypothetical protein VMR74_09880 [Gammaproteobacteria bacterium]|nr:hypothetical protein [Gammaproteobacteria bacterium]
MLEFIESTAIATWVRESPSIFGYTFVLSLHAIGLAIVVGVSAVVALRAIGRFGQIPLAPMLKFYPVMWVGFTINTISGLMLLAANATGMLSMPMFYIKMAFIVAAVVTLSLLKPRLAAGSGRGRGLSYALLGFWLGAIVAGRLTAYPYFVNAWFGA